MELRKIMKKGDKKVGLVAIVSRNLGISIISDEMGA
jgi:hypothetical protein